MENKIKMNLTDLKVYAINTATLAVSFTAIEDTLKLLLLIASLGYTVHKWYLMAKDRKKSDS